MKWRFIALLILPFLGPEAALAQCAMCREASASASVQTKEALNWAIIGLAFTPYLVAFIAAWLLSPGWRALLRGVFGRRQTREPLGSKP